MLTRLGHEVKAEIGSLKALRTFSEQPDEFDVAIVDVALAEIPGLDLAQRFRRIQPGFPVILYSGDIDASTIRDAEQSGVSYCEKPAVGMTLESVIMKALRKRVSKQVKFILFPHRNGLNHCSGTANMKTKYFSASEMKMVGVDIIYKDGLILKCNKCGQVWWPMAGGKRRLPSGYWKCPDGCNALTDVTDSSLL